MKAIKNIFRFIWCILCGFYATSGISDSKIKYRWDTIFRDLMIALNVGLFSYILFIRVLELPIILGFIEIGFAAVIACLTMTKEWTETK